MAVLTQNEELPPLVHCPDEGSTCEIQNQTAGWLWIVNLPVDFPGELGDGPDPEEPGFRELSLFAIPDVDGLQLMDVLGGGGLVGFLNTDDIHFNHVRPGFGAVSVSVDGSTPILVDYSSSSADNRVTRLLVPYSF